MRTAALIEDTIEHQVDDPALGLVDFSDPIGLCVTVDDDGPADFTTVNPAVQAVRPGGKILVRPGLYEEDVVNAFRHSVRFGHGGRLGPDHFLVLKGASGSIRRLGVLNDQGLGILHT